MIKVGPIGNVSDKSWDDKGKAGLCGIYVYYDRSGVVSLQFAYKEGTAVVLSEKFGGRNGSFFHSINLDYPSECITSISGYYNSNYCYGIRSITFGTNRRTYGPFGSLVKNPSSLPSYSITLGFGEFSGFHGYSNSNCITAIGVYLKPYVGPSTSTGLIKSEPVG